MKKLLSSVFFVSALTTSTVFAEDEIEPRTIKIAQSACESCHGIGGSSNYSLFPRLAGQHAAYLEKQLKGFRDRTRADPYAQAYMWGIANPLSDAEIADLAKYFSAKSPAPGNEAGSPELLPRGEQLYNKGDDAQGIPACNSCHGDQAEGTDDFPRLAGQHADYLFRQLTAFRASTRRNEIMHSNTGTMNDDDARALAEYIGAK